MLPDSKVHGANMGPTWGRQDPDGSHIGPMNHGIWASESSMTKGVLLRLYPRSSLVIRFYQHKSTKIRTWISNYINGFIWDIISQPCPNSKVRAWCDKNMEDEEVAYKTPYFSFVVETMYFNLLRIQ